MNKIWIRLFCTMVGSDQFGNRYYIKKDANGKERRYVYYSGIDEGSKVPPMWHAWLHYMSDEVPIHVDNQYYSWQETHVPNLTGTKHAYVPKSYEPEKGSFWTPKN